MKQITPLYCILTLIAPCLVLSSSKIDVLHYKNKVQQMFYHAYNGYLHYAYPLDELQPITCTGHDTWGSYSLTLVDALDTLLIMGNVSEFQRVVNLLKETLDFDRDINVSVFETNIRIVGGLLSAHMLSHRANMTLPEGWPCHGPLLELAERVARHLLAAFDTPTGMPYGTVNLLHGVPQGETSVTCTAGVGTYLLEFGALSQLTGNPVFEEVALRAIRALWKYRSEIDLLGNHIDVQNGKWTALDSGIGAGVDSFFEYLVKGSSLFNRSELLSMFTTYLESIEAYLKKEDWYMWANMKKGSTTLPVFQSLEAFWPGMQSLIGDVDSAMRSLHNYHQVWKQHGFTPEFYNIPQFAAHAGREGYPLRPELAESVMYLYRATRDPFLLEVARDIIESIELVTKTSCGYATVKSVVDHTLEDRMESFFLAETTKYLFLIFDEENFIHNNGSHGKEIMTPNGPCIIDAGGYIFNTEAHPLDPAILQCCSASRREQNSALNHIQDNLDLLALLDIPSTHSIHKQWSETMSQRDGIRHDDDIVPSRPSPESIILDTKTLGRPPTAETQHKDDIKVVKLDESFNLQGLLDNVKKLVGQTISLQNQMVLKLDAKDFVSQNQVGDKVVVDVDQSSSSEDVQQQPEPQEVLQGPGASWEEVVTPDAPQHQAAGHNLLAQFPSRALTCPAQPFHMKISVTGEMFLKAKVDPESLAKP